MKMRLTQWIILGLLLLTLFHPVFHFRRNIPPHGILLIDKSESMKNIKRNKIETSIPLKPFAFGRNEKGTNIGKAMNEAYKEYPEASFMILFSDGSNTRGENPIEVAGKLQIPIYYLLPDEDKINAGFISVHGPNSAFEGDSVTIKVYYKVPTQATLEIKHNGKGNKKDVNKEGILTLPILPQVGKNNLQFNLLVGNEIIDRAIWSINVQKKRKLLILNEIPDWNYKFIKRYFENNRWKVEDYIKNSIKDENIFDYNIICILENPDKYKEKVEKYLLEGGKIIVISSASPNLDFLPIIASTLSKYRGELPEAYYLKPGGVKSNTKAIELNGEKIGYSIAYGKGTVIQLTYLELWRLALSGQTLYSEDLLNKLMDRLTEKTTGEKLSVVYSKKLQEGEDFILRFNENKDLEKSFFWDEKKIPVTEDSILIRNPSKGLHHFRIDMQSQNIEDSVLIVAEISDKMGIDSTMLASIADISGGGEWQDSRDSKDFQKREREIRINLRHNLFFIIFLLLLLFSDWVLWMRNSD